MKNKIVFITGGSRGIGRGIAHTLHNAGYTVIAIGKSTIPEFLDDGIEYVQADLATPEGVEKVSNLINEQRPSILINCLGIEKNSSFTDITDENYDLVMRTNVTCHLKLCQQALPHMVDAHWGKIVFITSVWGMIGTRKRAVYTMSKFALHGLAMSLADEYARDGVRVNCVAPGFINIDETAHPGRGPERNEFLAKKIPTGKLGTPTDIGNTVRWLVSEESDYITGQVIVVDGGFQNSGSRGEPF
jgi:NAD(P)-dependent dehydrogenase (short-subunit alcohol dehydrogenase family)